MDDNHHPNHDHDHDANYNPDDVADFVAHDLAASAYLFARAGHTVHVIRPATVEDFVPTPAALTITDPHGALTIRLADGEPAHVVGEIAEWWRTRRTAGSRPDIAVWLETTPLGGTVTFPNDAERGALWHYTLHLPATDSPRYPGEGPTLRIEHRADEHGAWVFDRDIHGEWQLLAYTDNGPFGEPPPDIIAARAAAAHDTHRPAPARPHTSTTTAPPPSPDPASVDGGPGAARPAVPEQARTTDPMNRSNR